MTFFRAELTPEGEVFTPLPDAASRWTGTHIRGPAITSLLARTTEREVERAQPEDASLSIARLIPARSTFDLHSPVPMVPCRVRAKTIKRGRTLWVVEAELLTGDAISERVVARCRAALVTPTSDSSLESNATSAGETPGAVWAAPLPPECVPPSEDFRPMSAQGRLYRSNSTEWSGTRAGHQNADRNLVWYYDGAVIEGESPTAYQLAARVADLGSYVINYGAEGLSYINTDVTLSLARLPEPGGVGVASELRTEHAGVSVGTATLFDAAGMCGTSTVTSVRHTKIQLTYE